MQKARDINNFNDQYHRARSASAAFQKGIYYLFTLTDNDADLNVQIVKKYQTLFLLHLTQLLLDRNYRINAKSRELKKSPSREEVDPASVITHSMLKSWAGFPPGHPLHSASIHSLNLYKRTVEARDNLFYRPYLLERGNGNFYWEDCKLIDLSNEIPNVEEIKGVFQDFSRSMIEWCNSENDQKNTQSKDFSTAWFFEGLFKLFEDKRDNRPTETILLTYTRMLSNNNQTVLREIKRYRHNLLDLDHLISLGWVNPDFIEIEMDKNLHSASSCDLQNNE